MTDDDLDRSYSALCESLASVGEGQAELFLSMVCLSLMARYERADDVLSLIDHVQAQCAAEAQAAVPPDPGSAVALDRTLSYRLHLVNKLTDKASADAYAHEFGLPMGQARCLAAIGHFAPLSVVELAARSNLDKGQASRAAQALVERGLVAKRPSGADARGVVLSLTPRGRRLWPT